jgi:hypothetical protein
MLFPDIRNRKGQIMKKLFSVLLIVGLGCFAIGCSGEPGVSVETDLTDEGEAAILEMSDPTAGLEDGSGPPAETTDGGTEDTTPK